MLTREPVVIERTGVVTQCLIDPESRRIFLPVGTDVIRGDTAGFREFTRRIDKPVDVWAGAGQVAIFEEGPGYLPDLGKLIRNAKFTTDWDTGDITLTGGDVIWTGPCHIESDPYAFDTRTDVGAQMVGSSVFLIKLPLDVIDVHDGDSFQVTLSRDARLLVRLLTIKSARANSDDLNRVLLAFDNQGD